MGLRLSPEKTRVVHIDDGFDFLGFHIRRMRKRGSHEAVRLHRALGQGDRLDQGPGADHDLQTTLHQDRRATSWSTGPGAAGLGELLPARCVQAALQRGRLLRLGADHDLAAPKKHRIGWPELRRRFCLPGTWRLAHDGQRFRGAASVTVDPVPLPRLPHPDPVDPITQPHWADQRHVTWRARCGESRTAGSAGGPGKRNSGNAVTAPRADPTKPRIDQDRPL